MGNPHGRCWSCEIPWASFLFHQEDQNRQGQKLGGMSWHTGEKELNNLGGLIHACPVLVAFLGLVQPALSTCWLVGLPTIHRPAAPRACPSLAWAQREWAVTGDRLRAQCPASPAAGDASPRAQRHSRRGQDTLPAPGLDQRREGVCRAGGGREDRAACSCVPAAHGGHWTPSRAPRPLAAQHPANDASQGWSASAPSQGGGRFQAANPPAWTGTCHLC